MKIAIDGSRYGHETATGVEWYSFHIINGLIKKILEETDDELVIYSRYHLDFSDEIWTLIKKYPGRFESKVLNVRRFWTLKALRKAMRKDRPDRLFVPSHVLPLSLPGKDLPGSSVIMIHDVAFRHLRESYSFAQYHYLNWSTKFAVKHAGKILVPSEATRDDLVELFDCNEEKIEVVHHGFSKPDVKAIDLKDSEVLAPFELDASVPYFFFVGRLEKKKNLARLIRAFLKFSESRPDFRLVLAGKRGLGFKEILAEADLSKVYMPGYITEEEKAALYKGCRGFVFPSLYEGFGLPILEAFAYGKPVLTSNVSCLLEVAGDAAVYVHPYDEESIVEGLEKLLEFDGEAGKERLEEFSWKEAVIKTYNHIYG